MQVTALQIPDILVLEPQTYSDARGCFYESFNAQVFEGIIGRPVSFVQDNHSHSVRHVLRGLHYQVAPHAQGKIVRATKGEVFDVAVDIRPSSPTFGQWVGEILSADNKKQMWIPEGFAHGFLTLSDEAEFLYKTTGYYAPAYERCIMWNDKDIGIVWPLAGEDIPILSPKDMSGKTFQEAEK